jgi:dephospho-CoA kinase
MAAGKSAALAALGRLGAATLSTDSVVHGLYSEAGVRDAVVARWGPEVAPDGVVDRQAIAGRVFADGDERQWLEGLLWPRVGKAVNAWHSEQERRRPAPEAIVVEVPLLFEAGMDALFDATIAVVADDEVRSQRAAQRGLGTVDERTARQLSQDEKAQRADFVIRNDGTREELKQSLSRVLAKIGT